MGFTEVEIAVGRVGAAHADTGADIREQLHSLLAIWHWRAPQTNSDILFVNI